MLVRSSRLNGGPMKLGLALPVLLCSVLSGASAVAQRSYSFEEACRNAGWTTGPCAPKSVQQDTIACVQIGANAFHMDKLNPNCQAVSLSPVFDAEILVEFIGLANASKLNDLKLTIGRAAGIRTAIATLYKPEPGCQCRLTPTTRLESGARAIFYDPEWVNTRTAEVYLTLAHEAGHHFCGHSLGQDPLTRKNEELEADRFSGASIRRLEVYHGKRFLDQALMAAERLYMAGESRAYPPRTERISAIILGYKSGSPCANLAAPVRGFSPHQR
jgi:hypothetical protein